MSVKVSTSKGFNSLIERQGNPFTILGAGHSGLYSTEYVVLSQSQDDPIFTADNIVRFPASWTLGQCHAFLSPCGLSIPVATTAPDATLGGVLSAGGFGELSLHKGALVEYVESIHLWCGSDSTFICSTHTNSELFSAVLCGGGSLGIIAFAEIKCRPLPYQEDVAMFNFGSLKSSTQFMVDVLRAECVRATLQTCRLQQLSGAYCATLSRALIDSIDINLINSAGWLAGTAKPTKEFRTVGWSTRMFSERLTRGCGFPKWRDYIIPIDQALVFVDYLEKHFASTEHFYLAKGRIIELATSVTRSKSTPKLLPLLSMPSLGVGVYFRVNPNDHALLIWCDEAHLQLSEACLQLGGRIYLGSNIGMTSPPLDPVSAEGITDLMRLRAEYRIPRFLQTRLINGSSRVLMGKEPLEIQSSSIPEASNAR